jgi:hypothetical protein
MGLSLGMKVDAHGRLVAPPPPVPGSIPEMTPEEEAQYEQPEQPGE